MYKGKFDQKKKGSGVSVHEIVTQRNTAPVNEPAVGNAPVRKAPAAAPRQAAPVQKPRTPAPVQEEPKRRGPRLGSVIFYTLYFLFILVFFVATYIGLQFVQNWLIEFDAAQPTVKAEYVFSQLFTDPNWGDLYESAGIQDTQYEGKEEFVAYMEEKVGNTPLTFLETSAGLSGDKKYAVRLGNEKVATFTLVDRNAQGATTLENITELPDWQLGSVEVFFEREESYLIEMVDGHTAIVNGVALTEDHTIQVATTLAEKYLPAGTTGAKVNTQQITGLMALPTVEVYNDKGEAMIVTYDEETRTFTERTESNTMPPEVEELALNASKAFCLWMIKEGNRADIAKYYDSSSEVYNEIIKTTEVWMQKHGGYTFANESVTNYAMYTDNLFSVRVSLDLEVKRTDGTTKAYPYATSLFFHKTAKGDWKVFDRTNVDVSQPVGRVRLTFMHGDTLLTSKFFENGDNELNTPTITPVPEGKVFSGWVQQTENEKGQTVLTVVFKPDETGKVVIPEGTILEPMVLYALFEDASAATAASAPETTEGA